MKIFRYKFYRVDVTKEGEETKRTYLGSVDVVQSKVADGSSLMGKAFRLASQEQRNANAVEVQEL
jgi:hypothetical protein